MRNATRALHGTVFAVAIFSSAFLGVAFFQHVLLLGLVATPVWYRKYVDQLVGYWMVHCAVNPASFGRSFFLIIY